MNRWCGSDHICIYVSENDIVSIFSGVFGNVLKNEKHIFCPSQTQCRWEKITKGINYHSIFSR